MSGKDTRRESQCQKFAANDNWIRRYWQDCIFNKLLHYLQQKQSQGKDGHELYLEQFTIDLENSETTEEQDILDGNHSLTSFMIKKSISSGSLEDKRAFDKGDPDGNSDEDVDGSVVNQVSLNPPDSTQHQKGKNLKRQGSTDTDPEHIVPSRQMLFRVSVWNFGGGDQSFHTNHIFLSSDAIYLLVFKLSEQESPQDMLKWIWSVGTYSSEKKADNVIGTPTILLVGKHCDLISGTNEGIQQNIYDIENHICGMDELICIKDHVFGIFVLNNFDDDDLNI